MDIVITQRHTKNDHGNWIDSLENAYIKFFESLNLNLLPISNITHNVRNLLKRINPLGIVLSGGGDVDPTLYGLNSNVHISKERDRIETELLKYSVDNQIPVLGICRGMHFINVYFQGKLIQDITLIDKRKEHHIPGPHKIKITDHRLSDLLGQKETLVNSYHNQGILKKDVNEDIGIFALSSETELVEGFFHKNYPIAGIQWHPEREKPTTEINKILINSFIKRDLFWKI